MDALVTMLFGGLDLSRFLVAGALVALRLLPLVLVAPWLSTHKSPILLRVSLLLCLTFALSPGALAAMPAGVVLPQSAAGVAALALRELVLGLAFALATTLPLFAVGYAGAFADGVRGASNGEVLATGTGERTTPLGAFFLLAAVAVFIALGGHRLAIDAIARSFVAVPLGVSTLTIDASFTMGVARIFAEALAFTAQIGAPIAVAAVLAEIAVGLVARSAPQIPVFFAAMPLRAGVALFVAALVFSMLVGLLPDAFRAFLSAGGDLLRDASH